MRNWKTTRIGWWVFFAGEGHTREWLRYRLTFTWRGWERCSHLNRLGLRCFRPWTYDHWCGMHNSLDACRGHMMATSDHRKR